MDTSFLNDLPKNVYLGSSPGIGGVFLRRPSWDCGWYWGFGYLGNHFHLDGLDFMGSALSNKSLYDQIKAFFGDSLSIKDDKALWKFCEVAKTIYTLKESACLFQLGGAHYSTNPDKEALQIPEYVKHINEVLIPLQIRTLYAILKSSLDPEHYNR
jgi:hypothetical protein